MDFLFAFLQVEHLLSCHSGLEVKQPFLPVKATCIAHESAIGTNDPMTGNDDSDIVFTIGSAHCTDGFRIADIFCELQIGGGFTVGDIDQLRPHLALKVSA